MQQFLHLIKKDLTGTASEREQALLQKMTSENGELRKIYEMLFINYAQNEDDGLSALKAYEKHCIRIKCGKRFDSVP